MKRTDIEHVFTETVSRYIADGYILHPTSMCGHQGEIAEVDLYKGDDFIRVMLTEQTSIRSCDYIQLSVLQGVNTERPSGRPFDTFAATVWHDDLTVIEEHQYFWLAAHSEHPDYYTPDLLEAVTAEEKRKERWTRKHGARGTDALYSDKVMAIAVAYVKRVTGAKRVDKRRLSVTTWTRADGSRRYSVIYGSKTFRLC